ncbi:hypothetical protein [Idiomarina abyssalis]|uniref:hypothetical protein n=1 Tax=Idiomarina abyssalis TaxID=86102 RepID=UPI003A8FFFBA|tara:strand:+ start:11285 stop:11794 length:510 start_codon:yes stop_codon:yes gene_type:complete
MSDKTLEAWKNIKQTQQKYDYFILGLSSALFAYLGTRFSPEPLSLSQSSFELAALTCFAVSVLFGIFRLESEISVQSTDYKKAQAQDRLDVVNKIVNLPYRNIDLDSGHEISGSEAREHQEILKEFVTKSTAGLEQLGIRYKLYFTVRNYSLFAGFIFLVVAKYIALFC